MGVTSYRHKFASKLPGPALMGAVLSDDYTQGVEVAGGLALVIPFVDRNDVIPDIADCIHGLLLSGGDDVDPAWYGEQPQLGLGEVNPERDELELRLIAEVVARGKPILGICRGIQVLNVAFGGTLYQDLPRQWKGTIQHSQRARRDHLSHTIRIQPGSRLQQLLGGEATLRCNSFHHQAIRTVGRELVPVAWDEDGLVEAVEHPDYPFLVGVQWHPENLWRTAPVYLGLFRGLVEAARRQLAG
ncbi:MAG: gamma-glutamyl-gamma-aminobutyrate hydrolase family protein [Alicyclobacillaceae bacterium]|nr:gamma-glutamyl-gamma-aminobutyrate hydrolase family protein [Alicyclobacillaceae bacterium]